MKELSTSIMKKLVNKMESIQEIIEEEAKNNIRTEFNAEQTNEYIDVIVDHIKDNQVKKGGKTKTKTKTKLKNKPSTSKNITRKIQLKTNRKHDIQMGGEIFTKAKIRSIVLLLCATISIFIGKTTINNINDLSIIIKKYILSDLSTKILIIIAGICGCVYNSAMSHIGDRNPVEKWKGFKVTTPLCNVFNHFVSILFSLLSTPWFIYISIRYGNIIIDGKILYNRTYGSLDKFVDKIYNKLNGIKTKTIYPNT